MKNVLFRGYHMAQDQAAQHLSQDLAGRYCLASPTDNRQPELHGTLAGASAYSYCPFQDIPIAGGLVIKMAGTQLGLVLTI